MDAVEKAMRHDVAKAFFNAPVDERDAPGYYDVIKRPTDFSKVLEHAKRGKLRTAEGVRGEVERMWANCLEYNPPENPVRDACMEMAAHFDWLWSRRGLAGSTAPQGGGGSKDQGKVGREQGDAVVERRSRRGESEGEREAGEQRQAKRVRIRKPNPQESERLESQEGEAERRKRLKISLKRPSAPAPKEDAAPEGGEKGKAKEEEAVQEGVEALEALRNRPDEKKEAGPTKDELEEMARNASEPLATSFEQDVNVGANNRQLLGKARELVDAIKDEDMAAFFRDPVDTNLVPEYERVIKRPMDLNKVAHKIRKGRYKGPIGVLNDVNQVWRNCFDFNHRGDAVWEAGVECQREFLRRWREAGLPEKSPSKKPQSQPQSSKPDFSRRKDSKASRQKELASRSLLSAAETRLSAADAASLDASSLAAAASFFRTRSGESTSRIASLKASLSRAWVSEARRSAACDRLAASVRLDQPFPASLFRISKDSSSLSALRERASPLVGPARDALRAFCSTPR